MTKPKTGLTAQQRVGAALEAADQTVDTISKTLDVNKKTVQGWRKDERYLAYVDELGRSLDKDTRPMIHQARIEILEAHTKALATLVEALEATTKDGRPATSIRVTAASLIEQYALKIIMAASGAGGETGSGGDDNSFNMQNNFTVVLGEDGRAEVRPAAIEGTAEELD